MIQEKGEKRYLVDGKLSLIGKKPRPKKRWEGESRSGGAGEERVLHVYASREEKGGASKEQRKSA